MALSLLTRRTQYWLPRAHEVGESATVQVRTRDGGTQTYTLQWQKTGTPYIFAGPVPAPRLGTSVKGALKDKAARRGAFPPYMANARKAQVLRAAKLMITGFGEIAPVFAKGLPESFVQRVGAAEYDGVYSGVIQAEGLGIRIRPRLPELFVWRQL